MPILEQESHLADPQTAHRSDSVQFSLVDVVLRVIRGKYVLLATTILGCVIGFVIAKVEKPWYFAQAVFLPPKYTDFTTSSPVSSVLLGASDAGDAYLGLLNTRTVQDDVVDHLHLKSVFHVNSQGVARYLLSKDSGFGVGRNSLIYVNITADDPNLAAAIGNEYLDALYRLNGAMVESSSSRRADFFQSQLGQQRDSLMKAEEDLKNTQVKTGLVLPGSEAQADVAQTAQLQSAIGSAESRLAGLLVGETDQAPEVVQARAELRQLRAQLEEQRSAGGAGRGIASTASLPGLTLDVAQKEREVRLNEAGYEGLLQQYGRARLASIDPGPQLEVVDRAVVPEFRAGPNRNLLMKFGAGIGLAVGLLYLLFFEPLRRLVTRTIRTAREKA